MSDRELVVLGTASQAPTRVRNHNGYLLLWDDEGVLVDPGEGTQRQLLLSGVRSSRITRICLTHLHGDHCLGLPGVLARLSQDRVRHPVHLHFPASGQPYVERLLTSSIIDLRLDLVLEPVEAPGTVVEREELHLSCAPLEHSTDCLGWRVESPSRPHLLPDELRAHGVRGPLAAELRDSGRVEVDGHEILLEQVSSPSAAHSVAFVFDTRWCPGAVQLARDADLLVCESTFLDEDAGRAERYGHLTAAQAGRLAAECGAARLLLTHFSSRYPDPEEFRRQAGRHFDDVLIAEDLMRVPLPRPPRPAGRRR